MVVHMKKNVVLVVIAVFTLFTLIAFATYAYLSISNLNVTNVANFVANSERNNMTFDTFGGNMSLNITASAMQKSHSGTVAASNTTTLVVNFTANSSDNIVCKYDIVYEWKSSTKYTTLTTGVTGNEFTIQASLGANDHANEGLNSIYDETNLSVAVGNVNSKVVVSEAKIESTGTTMNTATWTLSSKFYNAAVDQSALANKNYEGRFKVANVSCTPGNIGPTQYWYATGSKTFPNHGTLKTTGLATGKTFYIGQDSTQYYTCTIITGHEVCLSQPYTQYGLNGHSTGTNFTTAQQTSIKNALLQVFNAAGIASSDLTCGTTQSSTNTYCYNSASKLSCGVTPNGGVYCHDGNLSKSCSITSSGTVTCS